eukprot:scaffold157387_cov30-Tisochrysis_lutea.AAC.1
MPRRCTCPHRAVKTEQRLPGSQPRIWTSQPGRPHVPACSLAPAAFGRPLRGLQPQPVEPQRRGALAPLVSGPTLVAAARG